MPKIPKERTQENQRRIEAAALRLFTTQGFHGTNNREIAQIVGVSTGTIYTYFPSKEAIFATLAQRHRSHLYGWLKTAVADLKDPLSKPSLKKLAAAVESAMDQDPQFFLMLLSDVIEFKNKHFREVFHNVPQQFRDVLGSALHRVRKEPGWQGEDPAFVLASAHLYFFTYFLMEKHMQGEQHLGLSNERATECFIDLLFHGLWKRPRPEHRNRRKKGGENIARRRMLQQANRDRIAYIRFLSGRLWNLPPDLPLHGHDGSGAHPAQKPILFLPAIPRNRIDANQLQIEAAALELFTSQGFHGTNIRDIAEKAGISQGTIYTYYASKEAVFEGLVRSYRSSMRNFLERVFRIMDEPFSRNGLRLFAAAMRSMVYEDAEYWLLMYIDVIEFRNRHFLKVFHDVPEQFRRLLGPAVNKVRKQAGWRGQDPALVMAMIYFYFHTYFVIERLMHGNQHLGVGDDEVVEHFVDILSHGLWTAPLPQPPGKKARAHAGQISRSSQNGTP